MRGVCSIVKRRSFLTDRSGSRRHRTIFAAVASAAIGLWSVGSGVAQADATWMGTTSQDYNDGANWNPAPPGLQTLLVNTDVANVFPVLNASPVFTPVDVILGNGTGLTGRFDQTAGSLSLNDPGSNGNWFIVGRAGGTGTYNLTGSGSLTVGKLHIGGAYFGNGGTGTVTINTTGTVTANSTADYGEFFGGSSYASVSIGNGDFGANLGNGTLNLQAGTINAAGEIWLGRAQGTGTLNLTGGTINTSGIQFGKYGGTGSATVANGTINAGFITMGAGGAPVDPENATMAINAGGIVNSEFDAVIGFAGNNSATVHLSVNNGGTFNVASTTERWLIFSQYDGFSGTIDVNAGGVMNLKSGTDIRTGLGNNSGTRTLNVNGGSIVGTGPANGDATVIQLARGGTGSDVVNISNGGVVAAKALYCVTNSASAILNFDNGTLRSLGDDDFFIGLTGSGTRAVNILGGGATLDTNGFNCVVRNGLLAGDAANGGLTKTGAGTLTLIAASTYTGSTTVNAGTLALDVAGTVGTGSTQVNAGATLKINPTVTSVPKFASTLVLAGTAAAPTAKLDITTSGAILDYTGSVGSLLTNTLLRVKAGRGAADANGVFDYTGQGITSSAAALNNAAVGYNEFAIGAIDNADLLTFNGANYATFGLTGVDTDSILVRYTYNGDANLDGKIDADDYSLINRGFAGTIANRGWLSGDFTGDGLINADDYAVIDFGFLKQGTQLGLGDPVSVPEPASLGLLTIAGSALIGRRRRK